MLRSLRLTHDRVKGKRSRDPRKIIEKKRKLQKKKYVKANNLLGEGSTTNVLRDEMVGLMTATLIR